MADKQNDLLELVQTEQQLDEELTAARVEAGRIVEAARAAAGDQARGLEDEVARAIAELRQASSAGLEARLAALDADAARQVRSFEAVDDRVILRLAERMVLRLGSLEDTP